MGYDTKTEGTAVWYIPRNGNENERGKSNAFKRADIFIISAASCGSRHRYNCNGDVCKAHIDHISAAETQYRSNVYIYQSDMLELAGVLFVAVAVCYVVISRLLKSMKIAQALRLGEDS